MSGSRISAETTGIPVDSPHWGDRMLWFLASANGSPGSGPRKRVVGCMRTSVSHWAVACPTWAGAFASACPVSDRAKLYRLLRSSHRRRPDHSGALHPQSKSVSPTAEPPRSRRSGQPVEDLVTAAPVSNLEKPRSSQRTRVAGTRRSPRRLHRAGVRAGDGERSGTTWSAYRYWEAAP